MKINANKKTEVQTGQLRHLFSLSNGSILTSTLLAAILAYVQIDVIESSVILAWFFLILLVAASRWGLVNAYHSADMNDEAATPIWLNRFRIGVLAVGLV